MTLDLRSAATLEDLARQCDARTIAHLARLMLRTFATLGADEEWSDLPALAESLTLSAAQIGLEIDHCDTSTLRRWQTINDTANAPLPVPPAHDTVTVTAAALRVVDIFRDGALAYDIGPSLNCTESNALVDLLDSAGAHDAARHLRRGHAAGDEEGDEHHTPTT